MAKTFDYYRSTNGRLHAVMDQDDHYEKYLKRIERIVQKKPYLDKSASHYMSFRNKVRQIAKNHKSSEKILTINYENQNLLDRIIHVKKRKNEKLGNEHFALAMYEKRYREQEKINEENRKIAMRVISQHPVIEVCCEVRQSSLESPRRTAEKSFYQSRVKERKLPKLMQLRH